MNIIEHYHFDIHFHPIHREIMLFPRGVPAQANDSIRRLVNTEVVPILAGIILDKDQNQRIVYGPDIENKVRSRLECLLLGVWLSVQ